MTTVDTTSLARPRLRRDVLFTQTPSGVLFHDANGGFHLRSASAYRFVSALVPYLDGNSSVAELRAVLGEQRAPMMQQLVTNLIERGFARDVALDEPDTAVPAAVAARFEAQLNYVDHFVDRAHSRFAAFRNTRVAILGEDTIARWCGLGLIRNGAADVGLAGDLGDPSLRSLRDEADDLDSAGCSVLVDSLPARGGPRTWSDLARWDVVVCTGPDAARQALSLLAEGIPPGRVVLPVTHQGSRVVIGPLVRTEADPCVSCAALRIGANGDAADAADFWFGLRQGPRVGSGADGSLAPGPLAAMVGNLLAYEIFRLRTGALPAETDGHVLVQDVESLDVFTERLHVHPMCPLHPQVDHPQLDAASVNLADVEIQVAPVASVEDHEAAEAGLALLSRRTFSLVSAHVGIVTRFDDDALTQTPVKISQVHLGLGHGVRRRVAAVDLHTVLRARLSVLHCAAALYAAHVGSQRSMAPPVVAPARTMHAPVTSTGITGTHSAFAVGLSLLDGASVAVPAGAVYPGSVANNAGAIVRTSAGSAAGDTWSEAVTRGLLSSIAYDAVQRAVRGCADTALVDPAGMAGHSELNFLLRSAANLDAQVELIDLRSAAAPVVLARSGGQVAVRAGLDWASAATDALLDLVGTLQVSADDEGGALDLGDPLVPDLDPRVIRPTWTSEAPLHDRRTGHDVLTVLRADGLDAVAVDTTPGDLRAAGLYTGRVVLGPSSER